MISEQVEAPFRIVRFGLFEVDLEACELRKKGLRIKLQDQPLHILRVLIERPGEIVSREELRHRLWQPDTFVDFDHSLNTAMMRLREVLGDSSENPRFIETVPRKGYRFVAPVHHVRPDTAAGSVVTQDVNHAGLPPGNESKDLYPIASDETPAPATWVRKNFQISLFHALALVVALVLLTAIVSSIFFKLRSNGIFSNASSKPITSLVVLPMENLSGDKSQEYFADGMTDELIASLARISSIRVLSRTTAMEYKDSHESLGKIARDLGVDAVVEGTVLRSGDRVRITAELIQVSTDRHLWADTYESPLDDVLTLQNRVASAIVDQIRIQLTSQDKTRLASRRLVKPDAYEDFLKGLFYWNKRSREDLLKAIDYFQSATVKDPQYALAYAGLADCYGILGAAIVGTVPTIDVAPKAEAAAMKAVELDDSLAETQTALATVQFNYKWDWKAAERGFRRAIELNPNYATAHQRYSLYLTAMGRRSESLQEMERARSLDPLSVSMNFSLGWRLYMAREYDRALVQLNDAIEMDPSFVLPHIVLGQTYEQMGDYTKAIAELEKTAIMSHRSTPVIAALGHVYAVAGRPAEAHKILEELQSESRTGYVSPFYIALVYAGLKDESRTMEWLERAYADRSNSMVFTDVDPRFDSLRSNPKFQNLLQRMNFVN
ncbi:winged helix-turn-helix domain-containing protein [Tunturibacter empetritectus]|uniref:TolB-like protein/DNA-binding winged helix-turn-helix (WHTH) protein/Tfp pilus assembly protein PilF n=1 Tax=Tunturiibacter lichenicola TaxID=2051959 RepID=A0A7W8J9L0_9BACT|nr:winged helix-turn-helix domain-containing protein [Edaphobacter lichenicola]MBB5343844.1 TolB-like protein/DNA-binding winged helix-turn-helix (wHTH) protein/Tfp pilus assembly protein PilF [Edaphobacter lichenicola]